ncbi:hypothetical protein COV11_04860 [Candidatus Woesearchaeota archaeon CG10_big_fil_rev_8_21_14_0_10_30_7]|nr:MAG: hypothetical protein COV11_04860 [Candidatus Woesearchaeota archaeon CG10_big_fil_rev_8_21_14_0_10_30_7]
MRKQILLKIGLSSNEADLYLALLEMDASLVSKIVEKTKLNRTNIYDLLEKLINKGLVSYVIKNNRKYFHAAKPERILRYLEEKEEKLKEEKTAVQKILPELKKIRPSFKEELVEVYEGKEGFKTILEDIIRTKQITFTYGSQGNFSKILDFYFTHYLKRLEKNKIKMKVIFNSIGSEKFIGWKFVDARYIPNAYKTPTETTVYGNKVAIFLFTEQPRVILVTSKTVSESYKKQFELLWKIAKK